MRFEIPAPPGATFGGSIQVAPDGREVAFIATPKGGMSGVWVRPLDSTEARPLAGTEGASG